MGKQGARFAEVAYLKSVCWLDLKGEIRTKLPPGTYTLSWVLQFKEGEHNGKWQDAPVTFTFTNGSDVQMSEIEFPPTRERGEGQNRVQWRENEWFEYCAGSFTVERDNLEIADSTCEVDLKFELKETVDLWWKSGLFVDGVLIQQQIPSA
ncbi:hypothetical protein Mapa_017401 [Marchantia paleacea]|nr:hypothetical protein Mapa_017401 [Marchantia paleacea]